MHIVQPDDLRGWLAAGSRLDHYTESIGRTPMSEAYLEEVLGLPLHLSFVMRKLVEEDPDASLDGLASIPFYSLCRGLFLPLSSLSVDRVAHLFGVAVEPPPNTQGREELLNRFVTSEVGLDQVQKLACILGDPFRGKPATLKRDSLITLLLSRQLTTRRQLIDRLTVVGDVAVLFAEAAPTLRVEPALTASEVLETLRVHGRQGRRAKLQVRDPPLCPGALRQARGVLPRQLILRKAGFGFDYQGQLIARVLGDKYGAQARGGGARNGVDRCVSRGRGAVVGRS